MITWRLATQYHANNSLAHILNCQKVKSIKKAVYNNYLSQLKEHGIFYSDFIELFFQCIKDVNILVKFIEMKFETMMYVDSNKKQLIKMISFLKQYYSEKQLLDLFINDFNTQYFLFKDTANEFILNKDFIEEKFIKVPCKITALHDEFVRCSKEKRYLHIKSQVLTYTVDDKLACIEIDKYIVKLPHSGEELFKCAEELHNCMAGYFDKIKEHKTLIYCFFQGNSLKFAVEVQNNTIIQVAGKYNNQLNFEEKRLLKKWSKQFYLSIFSDKL